jgi:hypothetical protein
MAYLLSEQQADFVDLDIPVQTAGRDVKAGALQVKAGALQA